MNRTTIDIKTWQQALDLDSHVITQEALLGQEELIVRPVASLAELRMVYRLVHDCYVDLGVTAPQPSGLFIHYPGFEALEETHVLVAVHGGEIVGTVSMTLDGPAGLPVEDHFRAECESIRSQEKRLATVWRIAIKPAMRASRRTLQLMIKEMVRRAFIHDLKILVIAVSPNHEGAYRRMLNMYPIAWKDLTHPVHATTVLLRCDTDKLPPHWQRLKPSLPMVLGIYDLYRYIKAFSTIGLLGEPGLYASRAFSGIALSIIITILRQVSI